MSPDPLLGDLKDPQSLNRYAYVRNNPLNLSDPTGLRFCQDPIENDGNGPLAGEPCPDDDDWFRPIAPAWFMTSVDPTNVFTTLSKTKDALFGQEMGRADSIRETGWDPELGIQRLEYYFVGGDESILEKQKELAAIQFGKRACGGQSTVSIEGCIQQTYDTLTPVLDSKGNPLFVGGNSNWYYTSVSINGSGVDPDNFGCAFSRCGVIDPLDFSHGGGTFHVDTANPWFIPIGSLIHFGFDFIGGHLWWRNGIPR
jgi:hypothetical protein